MGRGHHCSFQCLVGLLQTTATTTWYYPPLNVICMWGNWYHRIVQGNDRLPDIYTYGVWAVDNRYAFVAWLQWCDAVYVPPLVQPHPHENDE